MTYRSRDKQARHRERETHERLERGIALNSDKLRYLERWKDQTVRAETKKLDDMRRFQRKTELFMAETERKFKEAKQQSRRDIRAELRREREDQEYERRRRGG